jgi:hypothetical protein
MVSERGPPEPDPASRNSFLLRDRDERLIGMKTFLEAADIAPQTVWTKSGRSGAAGHCVELAEVGGGVALRHSKAPGQGAFVFSREEIGAFVAGAKAGPLRSRERML